MLVHPRICSIFLFLFCGLLLQTDPDGISRNHILFGVLVGTLTTSIVGASLVMFIRSLARQTVRALYAVDSEEEDEEEDDDGGEDGGAVARVSLQLLPGVAEADETAAAGDAVAAGGAAAKPPLLRGQQLLAHAHTSPTTPQEAPGESSWK